MAQHWTPFTGAFATGYLYGLGLMIYDIGELSGKTDGIPKRFTTLIGHTGQDYGSGAASVASFVASVLTEIYLCNVCSCQEILRRNGRGQAPRFTITTQGWTCRSSSP
jgi:hypothetical protein